MRLTLPVWELGKPFKPNPSAADDLLGGRQ